MLTTSGAQQLLLAMVVQLAAAIATLAAAAAAAGQQQTAVARPIALPGCPDKCGNISIPYPFGTKDGCYFDPSFEVVCNERTAPGANLGVPLVYNMTGYYFGDGDNPPPGVMTSASWQTVDLVDLDVSRGEARVKMPVSTDCSLNGSYHALSMFSMQVNVSQGTFVFSATRNVLLGVGQSVQAKVYGTISTTNTSSSCTSLFDTPAAARNGSCAAGLGCCQADLPPGLGVLSLGVKRQRNDMWVEFPCTYAMAVERSWYNFSLQDLVTDSAGKFPRSVPIVLDWAIRNGSCPADEGAPLPMACRSDNSRCVSATNNAPGYLCKCKDGFDGSPYIADGCQDIDECLLRDKHPELRDLYPCQGICKNKIGGYDCTCKFGTKGDGKNGTCTTMFPIVAVATLGVIGTLSIVIIVVLFMLLSHQKRKTREFFIKNGGPILEQVNNIKLFKKEELKPIIQHMSNVIGKGGFGEVYKGILDNQVVAIKKSINVDKTQEKQFANEIIIQSRVIHKNITRLIGCCLEVDIPMLVYEFVPCGSLHDILHGKNKVRLSLDKRLNIAAGAAEGLAYMHSKTSTTILHGDIKPSNILLDDNFNPKISDFGISRLIAIEKTHTNFVVGDMCYMDPIYLQSGLLTKQSDVYSFGLTLLELLTRKKQKDDFGGHGTLAKAFLDAYTEKEGIELFDSEILEENNIEVLHKLAVLIVQCLQLEVERRPEMINVAEILETMRRSHKDKSDTCASTSHQDLIGKLLL